MVRSQRATGHVRALAGRMEGGNGMLDGEKGVMARLDGLARWLEGTGARWERRLDG